MDVGSKEDMIDEGGMAVKDSDLTSSTRADHLSVLLLQVHQDNIVQLKLNILKHLPVLGELSSSPRLLEPERAGKLTRRSFLYSLRLGEGVRPFRRCHHLHLLR